MSDDSETVCPSGRVMARGRSLTDQARRKEIGEEEGRGSLAALSFRLRGRGRWKKESRSSLAVVVYVSDEWEALTLCGELTETRKLSKSQPAAQSDEANRPSVLGRSGGPVTLGHQILASRRTAAPLPVG